jgi:hypothetical protein
MSNEIDFHRLLVVFSVLRSFRLLDKIGYLCLMPFSTISQLYRSGQFYCSRTQEHLEKTTDLPRVTDKLVVYHIMLFRVHHNTDGIIKT